MENMDFLRRVFSGEQNKALYGKEDQRLNLDQLECTLLDEGFISAVRKQAESIACLIHKEYLVEKGEGFGFHPRTPTLAQKIEGQFLEIFGEEEAFRDELAPGFGTAFIVGKRVVMTAAHCICQKDSNVLEQAVIENARLVFGFHGLKGDYFFEKRQVYWITKVISHQFIRLCDKNHNFTDWSDFALLELNEDVPFTPLRMNMNEKIADKIALYMLGHPSGLPLKFTANGFVLGNSHKDFFECNLDAFGGNSGSFVGAASTRVGAGMLCSGREDYVITENYKGTGKKRIQASYITRSQIGQKGIGHRLENCQRLNTLRFLAGKELLGLEEIEPQNASELIVKSLKENYRSQNRIARLLQSSLPIEEVYSELVLIEYNKEFAFDEHRLNIEAKKSVELSNIFDFKHLLVVGRAGIGKSTLCQYIAYQWAEGKLTKNQFDAVFWVPLRKLNNVHSAENAFSFLFRLCCQEHSQELYPKDLADYIQEHKDRILFILDGLDEVVLEESSLQKKILGDLLKYPHWIVTTRPHAASSICADATIENVGFAAKTIDTYIQKSFQNNAEAIIQKIHQNPMIFGLCHIPIQLELVCAVLQKSKGDASIIHSMTSLYEELTLTLQRRFLEKLGKESAWDWQPLDMEKDSEFCHMFQLLELIAWQGMQGHDLSFSFKRGVMNKIYCESYPSSEATKREPLFKNLCNSGFLQSSGDSPRFLDKEYSFLHLTLQEFFAARYLFRLLQTNTNAAALCIQKIKFNPRYKVVLWFIAGLLKNEGGKYPYLNTFFDILDGSNGLYEILLKVRCLEECGWKRESKKLKYHEQEIQFWSKKMDFRKNFDPITEYLVETFAISPERADLLFPVFRSALLSEVEIVKVNALNALVKLGHCTVQMIYILVDALKVKTEWFYGNLTSEPLGRLGRIYPQIVVPLLAEIINSQDFETKVKALLALGYIGKTHPGWVLPYLDEAIQDMQVEIRREAARAFCIMGCNAHTAQHVLINDLKDDSSSVRKDAINILGRFRGVNITLVLPELIKALRDAVPGVRNAASNALGEIGQDDLEFVVHELEIAFDNDVWIREDAMITFGLLGKINPHLVFSVLIKALGCDGPLVKETAVKILGFLGGVNIPLILPVLIKALKDKKEEVRIAAANAIGKLGETALDFVFLELSKAFDNDVWIRKEAIIVFELLGNINLKFVQPVLIRALKDNAFVVRHAAANTLFNLVGAVPKECIPWIINDLKNDITAKKSALETLGRVGGPI